MTGQQPLCGILNVDKPLEWSSHEAVAMVRKWCDERRVGHAGTLDPLATGVLLLCLGAATRVSQYLMASTKVYRTTLQLGLSTTTHDTEGKVVARHEVDVSLEQFVSALRHFVGQIDQVPPAYSAVKRQGKRLYEYAREGIQVQVPPRRVEIHDLSVVDWTPPEVTLDVTCGPGTYVRALARDLGQALGCGALLLALRRTASGRFGADQAVPLAAIGQVHNSGRDTRAWVRERLHPVDVAFAHLPAVRLDAHPARCLTMGQGVPGPAPCALPAQEPEKTVGGSGGLVPTDGHSRTFDDALQSNYARAYGPGNQFLALVLWDEDTDRWYPRKVFAQPDEL